MPNENLFSKRLQAMRSARGINQEELARKANLQPTAVSHFETGSRKPSFDNLRRLADALDTTVDYLMGRTNEPTAALPEGDQMFRHFQRLTDEDRETARNLVEYLASKKRRST